MEYLALAYSHSFEVITLLAMEFLTVSTLFEGLIYNKGMLKASEAIFLGSLYPFNPWGNKESLTGDHV